MPGSNPKLNEVADALRSYLQEEGERQTTERFAILEEIVEEIYDHEVERHALRFYGRCRMEACRSRYELCLFG